MRVRRRSPRCSSARPPSDGRRATQRPPPFRGCGRVRDVRGRRARAPAGSTPRHGARRGGTRGRRPSRGSAQSAPRARAAARRHRPRAPARAPGGSDRRGTPRGPSRALSRSARSMRQQTGGGPRARRGESGCTQRRERARARRCTPPDSGPTNCAPGGQTLGARARAGPRAPPGRRRRAWTRRPRSRRFAR